jgi:hypothetical protein
MYDEDKLTVDQIAETLEVARSTLYRELGAYKGDCALVVYRSSKAKVDPDTNRRYGETGQSEAVQLDADRKWWPIASSRRRKLKAIVYVVDGVVARVRGVDPGGQWRTDDRGYADVPLTAPLTDIQIAEQLPTLGLQLGDERPRVKGKLREYVRL